MRAVAVAVLLSMSGVAQAQERVPPSLGLLVMLKVVTYDAAFAQRGSGDFVVLVPYVPGKEADATALVQAGGALEVKSIKERPLRFLAVPLAELETKGSTASAVVVSSGLPADAARSVLATARARRWYALAFDEALVKDGAVLGVGLANGKPQPLINVTAARAVGAEFAAAVLKLSRTFQDR